MQAVIKIDNSKNVRKVVYIILSFNISISLLKFTIGFFGHSQALIADAIHSLSDGITDLAVILGSFYWGKPPDVQHPHGHQRIETLITIIIGMVIFFAGIGIGWHAIITMQDVHTSSNPSWIALVMIFISMISQEIICRLALKFGGEFSSTALIASALEHRTDAVSSIPAFFAILGAIIFTKLSFLDNVGAIIVSIFIVNTALKILIPRIQELLEHGASLETLAKIENIAYNHTGVRDIHKVRTRYLGFNLLLDFHLVVESNLTVKQGHDIAEEVKKMLLTTLPDLVDVVVHIEPDDVVVDENHQDD